jgi:hypothetical protein
MKITAWEYCRIRRKDVKQIAILATIVLMSGFAYANDPNEAEPITVSISENIMTVKIFLNEDLYFVYLRSNPLDIIGSIETMLDRREKKYRKEWLQKKADETPTTEMN